MWDIDDLETAVDIIKSGGVLLYPTDTIWGLGCDATNSSAVEKLFNLKKRPEAKAMISLVDSLETLKKWVKNVPEIAKEEISRADKPLTIIYNSPIGIDSRLVADDDTAAFRITGHPFSKELCTRAGVPLVSTSANISGSSFSGRFSDISEELIKGVDYVCRHERLNEVISPSRIIKISSKGGITIIRN